MKTFLFLLALGILAVMAMPTPKPSYEKINQHVAQTTPNTTIVPATAPVWSVQVETSQVDDSKNVIAYMGSNDVVLDQYNNPTIPQLMIACREKSTSVYVTFGKLFMADIQDYGVITYRIDKEKAGQLSMNESTDHHALGLWRGAGISFAKKLIGRQSVFMRVTPYGESPISFTYSLNGYDDALKQVRTACRW